MLLPNIIKKDINSHSGYLSPRSIYSGKNLKGLFRLNENRLYLTNTIFMVITDIQFIELHADTRNHKYLREQLLGCRKLIGECMQDLIETQVLPYDEDIQVDNPVVQLHHLNKSFIQQTSLNFIQNPDAILPRYYAINPDTGADESSSEYGYNAESYSDGTWHPEHLFTNSARNKDNPYWIPLQVSFVSGPEETGLGHRYYDKDMSSRSRTGAVYSKSQRTRSQFPRWQDAGARRQYETDQADSFREIRGERRVQTNRGYDMTALIGRSTY
jgi:hypothetical protein